MQPHFHLFKYQGHPKICNFSGVKIYLIQFQKFQNCLIFQKITPQKSDFFFNFGSFGHPKNYIWTFGHPKFFFEFLDTLKNYFGIFGHKKCFVLFKMKKWDFLMGFLNTVTRLSFDLYEGKMHFRFVLFIWYFTKQANDGNKNSIFCKICQHYCNNSELWIVHRQFTICSSFLSFYCWWNYSR